MHTAQELIDKIKNIKRYSDVNFDNLVETIIANDMHADFENAEGKELTLFIGKTGAGKSTMVNYLRGVNHKITSGIRRIRKSVEAISPPEGLKLAETSSSVRSKTLCPKVYPLEKEGKQLLLVDFPGFDGVRPDRAARVLESLSTQIVINNAKAIKTIVINVDANLLFDRGGGFLDFVKNVSLFLEDAAIEDMSFIFLFNKIEVEYLEKEEYATTAEDVYSAVDECKSIVSDDLSLQVGVIQKLQEKLVEKTNLLASKAKSHESDVEVQKIKDEIKKYDSQLKELFDTKNKLEKQVKFLELCNKQNTFLPDITKGEHRGEIVNVLLRQEARDVTSNIFNFKEYDQIRSKFDKRFISLISGFTSALDCYATIKINSATKDQEKKLLQENIDTTSRRLKDLRNDKIGTESRKEAEIKSLKITKRNIKQQIKLIQNEIRACNKNNQRLTQELSNINPEGITIRERGPYKEERAKFFFNISWTQKEIEYNEPTYPYYKYEPFISKNGSLSINEEDTKQAKGKFFATYKSGYGEDGYCWIKFYIRNKDIYSNKIRIEQIEENMSELQKNLSAQEIRLKFLLDALEAIRQELKIIINSAEKNQLEKQKHIENIENKLAKLKSEIKDLQLGWEEFKNAEQILSAFLKEQEQVFLELENLVILMKTDTASEKYFIGLCEKWKADKYLPDPVPGPVPVPDFDLDENDPDVLYKLASSYEHGEGKEQNFALAYKFYKQAADLKHPLASYRLGDCYEFAIGVKMQVNLAKESYQRAFNLLKNKLHEPNNREILYYLGLCYYLGNGTDKNSSLAVEYFTQSAALDYEPAQYKLVVCYQKGEGIPQADKTLASKKYLEYFKGSIAINNEAFAPSIDRPLLDFAKNSRALVLDLANKRIDIGLAKKLAYFIMINQNILNIDLQSAILEEECAGILIKALRINRSIIEVKLNEAQGVTPFELAEISNCIRLNFKKEKVKFPADRLLSSSLARVILEASLNSKQVSLIDLIDTIYLDKQQISNIQSKADIMGISPMHGAAILGYAELIKLFFNKDLPINSLDLYYRTPLEYAAAFGHLEVVAELLDLGAVESENPLATTGNIFAALELAVIGNHSHVIKLLLLHPNASGTLRIKDSGDTLLHVAARFNSVHALAVLIAQPQLSTLDVNIANKSGASPIHIAAKFGSIEVIKFLVHQGTNVNLSTKIGVGFSKQYTPLEVAVLYKQKEVIDWLCDNNAEITPLAKELAEQLDASIYHALANKKKKRAVELRKKPTNKVNLSNIRNLVFKGGGVKGLGHIGALLSLYKDLPDFFDNIIRVAGTSAGAINALLLALGFKPDQMHAKAKTVNFQELMDGDEKEFINNFIQAANSGGDWSRVFASAKDLQFTLKQGEKAVAAAKLVGDAYDKGYYFACAKNILKTAAHSYVAYDEAAGQYTAVSNILNDISGMYTQISNGFGIFPGEKIIELFNEWIAEKVDPKTKRRLAGDLTFAELHALHIASPKEFKDLYVVVTNLSKCRPEVFSFESTPDVLIVDAVRASMCIPFFFKTRQMRCKNASNQVSIFSEDTYVDGGILMNLPIRIFDRRHYLQPEDHLCLREHKLLNIDDQEVYNEATLGFSLIAAEEQAYLAGAKLNPQFGQAVTGITQFLSKLILLYANSQEIMHMASTDYKRTVYINSLGISTVDFALNNDKQDTLLYAGKVGMMNYYDKIQIAAHINNINKKLLACLLKYADYKHLSKSPYGLVLEQIKIAISSPQELLNLLKKVQNIQELNFISGLAIDFNITDLLGKTILHLALEAYEYDQANMARVLEHIIALGNKYIDFSACDNRHKSVWDYMQDLQETNLFIALQKCIPGKHLTREEVIALQQRSLLRKTELGLQAKAKVVACNGENKYEFDVPADGTCLFYSVVFAFLLPAIHDKRLFAERFIRLFGAEVASAAEENRHLLHRYDGSAEFISEHTAIFEHLVNVNFRARLVAYMHRQKSTLESYVTSDFASYLARMKNPSLKEWGGALEIQAMIDFLSINIKVYQHDNAVLKPVAGYESGNTYSDSLSIVYTTASSEINSKNHYHFLLDAQHVAINSSNHDENRSDNTSKAILFKFAKRNDKNNIAVDFSAGHVNAQGDSYNLANYRY